MVPVGIELRLQLFANKSNDKTIRIHSEDLENLNEQSEDIFDIKENEILGQKFFGDYPRAAVNALVKHGLASKLRGVDIEMKSQIPIGSGLASSAAFEVAFIELLNHICNLKLTKREVAEMAFTAEKEEMSIPCGRLDQYGVTFGGILKLECRPPFTFENLPFTNLTFAIVDSGIRHSTGDIHPKRQAEMNKGLESIMKSEDLPVALKAKLGTRFDQPKWEDVTEEELRDHFSGIDNKARKRIVFTIRMQQLTELAVGILRCNEFGIQKALTFLGKTKLKEIDEQSTRERDFRILGEIMNRQHALLRDLYDVSLPKIDNLCEKALEAGAYGAKISGSGMGGSIIALVKNKHHGQKIVEACSLESAKKGWISKIGKGVKVEVA